MVPVILHKELEPQLPRPAARPWFRDIAAECMRRGDQALARLDLPTAAHHYATAGVTYRFAGASVPAAVAFLELAAAYLAQGQTERLAPVVESLRRLRPDGDAPDGLLFVRVGAGILERAVEKPLPFVEMLERLRRQRRAVLPLEIEFNPWPAPAGHPATPKESTTMTNIPRFTLPTGELRRSLAGHTEWQIIEDGARLERVIPLADLRTAARGRELRPLQRAAAELAQRIVRMGVAVSCEFNGKQVEIRVPATRLGLGFVEECDHAAVTGPSSEGAA